MELRVGPKTKEVARYCVGKLDKMQQRILLLKNNSHYFGHSDYGTRTYVNIDPAAAQDRRVAPAGTKSRFISHHKKKK